MNEAQVLASIDKQGADGCWLWTGCVRSDGYGSVRFAGRVTYPHRVVYEFIRGPVPEGLTLDHLCRVRHCVNPAHLEAVTHKENCLRGTSPLAVNAARTHCPRGHAYDEANTLYDRGKRTCRECNRVRSLAKYYARQRAAHDAARTKEGL